MLVEVRLFASFREGRFKNKQLELPDEGSLGNLLEYLDIPEEQAAILLVNGKDTSVDRKLAPGDVVSIFPAIGGG